MNELQKVIFYSLILSTKKRDSNLKLLSLFLFLSSSNLQISIYIFSDSQKGRKT